MDAANLAKRKKSSNTVEELMSRITPLFRSPCTFQMSRGKPLYKRARCVRTVGAAGLCGKAANDRARTRPKPASALARWGL